MIKPLLKNYYLCQLVVSVLLGGGLYGCATGPDKPISSAQKTNVTSRESIDRAEPLQVNISTEDLSQITNRSIKELEQSPCSELHDLLGELWDGKPFNIYKHVLPINSRGKITQINFSINGVNKDCLASFPVNYQNQEGWIKGIIEGIKDFATSTDDKHKTPVIYVFIHGGLNGYDSSTERISHDLWPIIKNDYNRDGKAIKYYPIFLVWNSGFGSTYLDSIFNYDQGQWDKPWWIRGTAPFRFFLRDVPDFAIHSPFSYAKSATRLLQRNQDNDYSCQKLRSKFKNEIDTIDKNTEIKGFGNEFVCRDERESQSEFNVEDIGYYGFFGLRFISVPAVDTFGKVAWKNMLARARFGTRQPCVDIYEEDDGACGKGAFHELFNALKKELDSSYSAVHKETADSLKKLEITLVGHSMGTIVASDLVRSFPDLPYNDVVFLGAAVSIREFLDSVQSVMVHRLNHKLGADLQINDFLHELNKACPDQGEARKIADSAQRLSRTRHGIDKQQLQTIQNLPTQTEECNKIIQQANEKLDQANEVINHLQPKPFHFFNLSLDEHAEAEEINIWGAAPRGSLLEWIDDMYETPSDFLERTMGKWKNVVAARRFFDSKLKAGKSNGVESAASYLHFEKFDLDCTSPLRHGELANNDRRLACGASHDTYEYWNPKYWRWQKDYL